MSQVLKIIAILSHVLFLFQSAKSDIYSTVSNYGSCTFFLHYNKNTSFYLDFSAQLIEKFTNKTVTLQSTRRMFDYHHLERSRFFEKCSLTVLFGTTTVFSDTWKYSPLFSD